MQILTEDVRELQGDQEGGRPDKGWAKKLCKKFFSQTNPPFADKLMMTEEGVGLISTIVT